MKCKTIRKIVATACFAIVGITAAGQNPYASFSSCRSYMDDTFLPRGGSSLSNGYGTFHPVPDGGSPCLPAYHGDMCSSVPDYWGNAPLEEDWCWRTTSGGRPCFLDNGSADWNAMPEVMKTNPEVYGRLAAAQYEYELQLLRLFPRNAEGELEALREQNKIREIQRDQADMERASMSHMTLDQYLTSEQLGILQVHGADSSGVIGNNLGGDVHRVDPCGNASILEGGNWYSIPSR